MNSLTYPTLEHVAMQARPYPTHLLEGCETGLCLFAAAFLGHNDAIHMAEVGMHVVCVDLDTSRLREMQNLYPEDWVFVRDDAWHYSEYWQWRDDGLFVKFGDVVLPVFDVVSADTFTGDIMTRSLASLDLWCSLARKAVTVTLTAGAQYEVPDGWIDTQLFERATGVYWLVLERA